MYGKEEIIYEPKDMDLLSSSKENRVIKKRGKGKGHYSYNTDFLTFDIETYTVIPDAYKKDPYNSVERPWAYMYIWGLCWNEYVIMGRTWEEWFYVMNYISRLYKADPMQRIVVYVHNLGYEFSFLYTLLDAQEVFAKSVRKPLKFYWNGFEFRCSWMLSNMSLEKFCENSEKCIHPKLSGEDFDYYVMRTSQTRLTNNQLGYLFCDVKGLHECVESKLEDDNLTTIPMTSTGYVRRDCRKAMSKNPINRRNFLKERLTPKQYRLMKKIFRGGDTHASRFFAGCVVNDLDSYDIKSSYPFCILNDYVPVGPLTECNVYNYADFLDLCKKYCVMFTCELFDVKIREDTCDPYIDLGHIQNYKEVESDNGRLLYAAYIKISLTEIDWSIIIRKYKIEKMKITECYFAKRGKIPKPIRDITLKYFTDKTQLDGIPEKYYEYVKKKNLLNGIYGMMVTDIAHDEIIYQRNIEDGKDWLEKDALKEDNINLQLKLDKYYESYNNFLSYQHGVYITCHARRRLAILRERVKTDSVYWDTDCLKFFSKPEYVEFIENYNNTVRKEEFSALNSKGERLYLGCFEKEQHIDKFKTYGAKKYAYITDVNSKTTIVVHPQVLKAGMLKKYEKEIISQNEEKVIFCLKNECIEKNFAKIPFKEIFKGKFHSTVAGMSKSLGAKEIIKKAEKYNMDVMKIFELGMEFENIGRTTAFYHSDDPHTVIVDNVNIYTGSNVGIIESTYTLGVTAEYYELLFEGGS